MAEIVGAHTPGKIIKGTSGNDALFGSKYPDEIYGRDGKDEIFGREGNDLISGGPGSDALYGDLGDDTVTYADAPAPVFVNLVAAKGTWGSGNEDTLWGFENVIGSRYDDTLIGENDHANTLTGGRGNDKLYGRGNNDTLIPGPGTDTVDGGDGSDMVSYAPSGAAVTVDLGNTANNRGDAKGDTYVGIENAGGTRFADTLTGNAGLNRLQGYARDEGPDVVTDFSLTQKDWLSFRASGFGGTLTPGPLPATSLVKGANPLPTTTATTFLYDTDTGQLFVDLDGIGGAEGKTELMTLVGIPAIDAGDFQVF